MSSIDFEYASGTDFISNGCAYKDVNNVLWVNTNTCPLGSGTFRYFGKSTMLTGVSNPKPTFTLTIQDNCQGVTFTPLTYTGPITQPFTQNQNSGSVVLTTSISDFITNSNTVDNTGICIL